MATGQGGVSVGGGVESGVAVKGRRKAMKRASGARPKKITAGHRGCENHELQSTLPVTHDSQQNASLQSRIFRLGLPEDGDVGVGIFP